MRGTGPVGWGDEQVYAYFTVSGGVTRVRVSVDEADRLGAVEGMRVALALPGAGSSDGLIVRVRREPPFVWVELLPLVPHAERRTG